MHCLLISCIPHIVSKREIGEKRAGQDLVGRWLRFVECIKDFRAFESLFQLGNADFSIVCRMGVELNAPLVLEDIYRLEIWPLDILAGQTDEFKFS